MFIHLYLALNTPPSFTHLKKIIHVKGYLIGLGSFAWSQLNLFLPELRIVGKMATTLEEHSWMVRNTIEAARWRRGALNEAGG